MNSYLQKIIYMFMCWKQFNKETATTHQTFSEMIIASNIVVTIRQNKQSQWKIYFLTNDYSKLINYCSKKQQENQFDCCFSKYLALACFTLAFTLNGIVGAVWFVVDQDVLESTEILIIILKLLNKTAQQTFLSTRKQHNVNNS